MIGTIVYLDPRGFGRINTDDGERLFFSSRAVDHLSLRRFDGLQIGTRVTIGRVSAGTRGSSREAWGVRWLADGEEAA